jgi:predicted solute-binding protein
MTKAKRKKIELAALEFAAARDALWDTFVERLAEQLKLPTEEVEEYFGALT